MIAATICRIVVYVLTHEDAAAINRRRTDGASIAHRMQPAGKLIDGVTEVIPWPQGAQAHIGNAVEAGMEFPAMVVRDWRKESIGAGVTKPDMAINLQVFLDGNDVYWATSVHQATGDHPSLEYGSWHWPIIKDIPIATSVRHDGGFI